MSAARASGRGSRRRRQAAGAHENEERWLLTYADMITLLLALFVVLFAISSVNTAKLRTLQESLRAAFAGKVMDGGESILESARSVTARTPQPLVPTATPPTPATVLDDSEQQRATAARREEDEFVRLKRAIDAYAARHGFAAQVETVIMRRGLVVRMLTDRVLFDSGQAELKASGGPLLARLASLLQLDHRHPIRVEGHTDDVPISTSRFASNWELSTARASRVVRDLIGRGVATGRFGAVGWADLHPLAANSSAAGRARNRRVEVVLQRLHVPPPRGFGAATLERGIAIP